MRLLPPLTVLARLADGVDTTRSVLGAVSTFLDELYKIADARSRHEPYIRPADQIAALAEHVQQIGTADAVIARIGMPTGGESSPASTRRGRLSLVPAPDGVSA